MENESNLKNMHIKLCTHLQLVQKDEQPYSHVVRHPLL